MGMVYQYALCVPVCQKPQHLKICHHVIQSAAQCTVKNQTAAPRRQSIFCRQQNIRVVLFRRKRFHILPGGNIAQRIKITHDAVRNDSQSLCQPHTGIGTEIQVCLRHRRL